MWQGFLTEISDNEYLNHSENHYTSSELFNLAS